MGWDVRVELTLEHAYYAPNMPPVTVMPAQSAAFARAGLLMRQSGARIFVLAEDDNTDLPETVTLDLETQNNDVVSVTRDADWRFVPQINIGLDADAVDLPSGTATEVMQVPGHLRLAQITIALAAGSKRDVTARFAALASHWAYHVIGPGNEDVVIEDAEGEVEFDAMGFIDLPDGTAARVIRSRAALAARARPGQRFSLSRPGPFGPRTLIPVLPAPQVLFASVPDPNGAGAILQSDIYVSIF